MDENVFNNISDIYDDVILQLENLIDNSIRIEKLNDEDFNPLAHFDILLQYSLLEVACSDADINPSEIALIETLTRYGDVFDYLRSKNFDDGFYWDNIVTRNHFELSGFLFMIREKIRYISTDFSLFFAAIDAAVKDIDYVQDLKDRIAGIVYQFAKIDGMISREELSRTTLLNDVLKNCETLKSSFEAFSNDFDKEFVEESEDDDMEPHILN